MTFLDTAIQLIISAVTLSVGFWLGWRARKKLEED